ncbi:MAG: hypothetical protein ACRDU5_10320 [Mycobacterium sp.]
MDLRSQRISLWITPFFGAVLLLAFVAFPGFFPPMSPEMTADQVAAFYQQNTTMIRFSMITFNLCAIMLIPFFMVIVVQIKRMATPSHVLAYSYLAAAATGATLFAIADIFWLIAAFRPARDPQLILLLNDLAWLVFVAPVGMIVVMNLCLALAIYLDARPQPIFPRWVAPFNLVTAAAMTPAVCAVVFKTGPLAWNGVISFWLRLGAFALYIAVMFFVVRTAISRQAAEEAAETETAVATDAKVAP